MKTTFYFKTKFLKKLKPLCTLSSVFLFLFTGYQEANAQNCITAVPRTNTIAASEGQVPAGWTMFSSPDGSNRYRWQNKYGHFVNGYRITATIPPDGSTNFLSAYEGKGEAATAPFTVTTAGSELTVYLGGFSTSGGNGGAPNSYTVDAQDVHITLNGTRINGVGTIPSDGGWHPEVFSNLAKGNYIFHFEPQLGASSDYNVVSLVVGPNNLCSPRVCGSTNALPTSASTTYTGAYATTDANGWTHYCSSDDKLLLSLDTAGSSAVVAANEVQLKLGASKTTSHDTAGGMIKNDDGYLLLDRLWDVSPTTQPSGEVGVRYYFTDAEYNALKTAALSHKNSSGVDKPTTLSGPSGMDFYKTSGTGFAMPHTSSTGTVLTNNNSTASITTWVYAAKGTDHSAEFKVTSFSGGGGGAGANDLPLPVELLAFTITQAGQHTAMLRWTTAIEINNNRFDIERSYDGRTFEAVGDVAGNGNSQHQIDYSYTDASVSKVQKTVYYRLKQVDFDGTYEYSDIRVVRFDAVGNDMQLVAYPNPMNDELNVMVRLSNGESYQLEVTNLQGKLVHRENHTYDNGLHKLNTSAWNSGMYIVRVATEHATKHMKIVKK